MTDNSSQPLPTKRRRNLRQTFKHAIPSLFLRVLLSLLVFLGASAFILSRISISKYVIVPGNAFSVESLIGLPKKYPQSTKGQVDMVDVRLIQLSALSYLYYAWIYSNDQIYSSAQITGPASAAQYQEQGVIDMANARQAATYVALKTLGYRIRAIPTGIIVYQPEPGSPAALHLADNDVISAVDGKRVTTFASVGLLLANSKPGEKVILTVHPFGSEKDRKIAFRLGSYRVVTQGKEQYLRCFPPNQGSRYPLYKAKTPIHGCLGLIYAPYLGGSEPYYTLSKLPFAINLSAEGIIGPSAGLAFTLGLLNRLDGGRLIGHLRIAATGTMSVNGDVGPIGGVKEKTIAVEEAGASLFFVPKANLASAETKNNGHLKIVGVTNIAQVVRYLEKTGGRLNATVR
jgi:PDZ domain-containing protein